MVVGKEKDSQRADPSGSYTVGPFSLLNVFIKGKLAFGLCRRILLPSLFVVVMVGKRFSFDS